MAQWLNKILISLGINQILKNQRGNFMGAEGGSEGGEGGSEGSGSVPPSTEGGIEFQYPEGFDETLKGNPTLMNFADKEKGTFNYANMMKSLVHAQQAVGKDKVPLPDESWSDDQWNDLFQKLGKPGELDAYEVKAELPENYKEDETFKAKFREMAFKNNLLPKQANEIYKQMNEYIHESISESTQQQEQQYNAQVQSLKQEWGEAFDQKCQRAYSALEQFASNDEIEDLKNQGYLDSPIMTKLFDKIAEGMQGDNFQEKSKGSFGMTPAEATEEISKMYRADHPYMNRNHPEHKYYQEKMLKLQRIKLKGRK